MTSTVWNHTFHKLQDVEGLLCISFADREEIQYSLALLEVTCGINSSCNDEIMASRNRRRLAQFSLSANLK